MADFSAVIRRAIESLSVNTPKERGRIYERARATIQRQMDSMPEGMNTSIFQAQLTKVEDAILQIEKEYAEGLSGAADEDQPEPPTPAGEQPTAPDQPQQEPLAPSKDIGAQTFEQPPLQRPVEPEIPEVVAEPPAADTAPTFKPERPVETDPVTGPATPASQQSSVLGGMSASPLESKTVDVAPDGVQNQESSIDSELEIPKAPQADPIAPNVVGGTPSTPRETISKSVDDVQTTNDDSKLIDEAVGEIRSTIQEDTIAKPEFSDPHSTFGFGEEALPEAPAPRSRKSPLVIIIAIVMLIAVAFAFFFWRVGWQGIQEMLPQSSMESSETTEQQADENSADEQQTATQTQNETGETETQEVASNSGDSDKFTQRLNIDGSEIDVGPATDAINDQPNEEGRSVAAVEGGGAAAQNDTAEPKTDEGAAAIQRMFFYETSLGLDPQARYEGSVVWSEQIEADATNSRPYIEGVIQVPERDISIAMTIKLNGDETLPVSHLIDLNFTLPENFDGGEIEQITEVKFKNNEEQPGDRLEAISAKIDTSFFVVGLQNDKLDIIEANLQLMAQRNWIDIPITYTNGRKALITLEKGATGKAIFDKVLAFWAQNPAQ